MSLLFASLLYFVLWNFFRDCLSLNNVLEKILESDWLTAIQFVVNAVRKQGNEKNEALWLANKQYKYIRTNQVLQITAFLTCIAQDGQRCLQQAWLIERNWQGVLVHCIQHGWVVSILDVLAVNVILTTSRICFLVIRRPNPWPCLWIGHWFTPACCNSVPFMLYFGIVCFKNLQTVHGRAGANWFGGWMGKGREGLLYRVDILTLEFSLCLCVICIILSLQ